MCRDLNGHLHEYPSRLVARWYTVRAAAFKLVPETTQYIPRYMKCISILWCTFEHFKGDSRHDRDLDQGFDQLDHPSLAILDGHLRWYRLKAGQPKLMTIEEWAHTFPLDDRSVLGGGRTPRATLSISSMTFVSIDGLPSPGTSSTCSSCTSQRCNMVVLFAVLLGS